MAGTAGKVVFFCALGVAGLMVLGANAEKEAAKPENICSPEGAERAFYAAQSIVEKNLRAPKTAEFVSRSADRDLFANHLGGCRFDIFGKVDAENGFGALIRSRYTMELEYRAASRTWLASELVID